MPDSCTPVRLGSAAAAAALGYRPGSCSPQQAALLHLDLVPKRRAALPAPHPARAADCEPACCIRVPHVRQSYDWCGPAAALLLGCLPRHRGHWGVSSLRVAILLGQLHAVLVLA